MKDLPRLIGICGNPKSGKSEVQNILQMEYGYQPVDDGLPMRQFAMDWLDLKWEDVATQEGKARFTEILGKRWQNRDILGTLGKQFEDMFGEQIMPFMSTRDLDPMKRYSFGSVRKTQGLFYKKQGGIIVEIVNPDAPPSPYPFDVYDRSLIDATIVNDCLAMGYSPENARIELAHKIRAAILSVRFETAA